MNIGVSIKTREFSIKEGKTYPSMNNARVIIPKKWECENVYIVPIGENDYSLYVEDGLNNFEFELNNEILIREVKSETKTGKKYVYIPSRFAGIQLLIVPF